MLTYTTRDFDSYFEEFKTLATTKFPTWTEFSESDIGVLFLELLAMLGDQDSEYLNMLILELFIMTVRRRRNAIRLFKGKGYNMAGRLAASVDLTFSIKSGIAHTKDIIIPAGYTVKTEDGKYLFQTLTELTIVAGLLSGTVTAKNWVEKEEGFVFTGEQNVEITLQEDNYIEDSAEVVVDGFIWARQEEDLLDSSPTDRHFFVEQDDELHAILIFGDNTHGLAPTGDGDFAYKYGGGIEANSITVGSITRLTDDIYDEDSDKIEMLVTNAASPSGGQDEESIDEARISFRKYAESDYTITREEYEKHSEEVDGVARCLAISKKEDDAVNLNLMLLFIVPVGMGVPSEALKQDVEDYLTDVKPTVHTTDKEATNPIYLNFNIAGAVYKKATFEALAVKTAVDAALREYFSESNLDEEGNYTNDFGFYKPKIFLIEIGDIIMDTTINGVKCVENVTLTTPSADMDITQKEFPKLVDLTGLVVS